MDDVVSQKRLHSKIKDGKSDEKDSAGKYRTRQFLASLGNIKA